MRRMMLAAVGAAMMSFAVPATAQEVPLVPGDYWEVEGVKIDDGHFAHYADFLAGSYRKRMDFAKSKGWIKSYTIVQNVHPRSGEPDLYLITVSDRIPTPAEQAQRDKEESAYMGTTERQDIEQSGVRATYRHITDRELLQVMNWAK